MLMSSALFFLIIGTAFFLVYQNASVMREQINRDFNDQQLVLARQAAYQIDFNLHDLEANVGSLVHLLDKIPQKDWKDALYAALERRRTRGLMEIGIVDAAGKILFLQKAKETTLASPADILEDCTWGESGAMVLGPLRIVETRPGVSTVRSVLCYRMGAPSLKGGILFARLDLSEMIGSVTSHIQSGKTGYAWTLNKDGVFLYHPEKEFIGKNAFTARKEREPMISFKQINRIMKEQMLHGDEGTGTYISGWHGGIEGNITKLLAFTPARSSLLAPGQGWSVAVAAPTSEVAEAVRRIYTRNFATEVALVVGMFVFVLLMAIYQNRMSQALQERVDRTEAEMHEVERIYQRVVQQATDLIYIFDLDMQIVIFNQQTVNLFKDLIFKEAEGGSIPQDTDMSLESNWKGKRLDELMRDRDAAFMRNKIDEVLEKNRSISYEHTISPKGKQVRLSTKLIPIRDDHHEVHYILGISRDMTEKMEMDHRIYNAEKLASIGILASGVAHEINNPLAVILGFTDLMLERFPEDSSEHEDLKMIEQNANHAKKVVQNLLGFARITEGLEDTVDVKQGTETVMQIAKNTLMTKKIEIETEIPENLPRVRGDAREFQQVIFNLINNAVAAMASKEGGSGKLTLSARTEADWVHVNVSDTGIGIPSRIKPQIFDPFFTTKKVGEGTGLGLSLCYGIMQKYGGRMSFFSSSAEDNPNRPTGTTFIVSLPVYQEEEE